MHVRLEDISILVIVTSPYASQVKVSLVYLPFFCRTKCISDNSALYELSGLIYLMCQGPVNDA